MHARAVLVLLLAAAMLCNAAAPRNESMIHYEYGNLTGYYGENPTARDVGAVTATICLGMALIIIAGGLAFLIIRKYLMVREL